MSELPLPGLEGTSPLGFLAALGTLDAVTRAGRPAALSWTDDVVPHAVLSRAGDLDTVLDTLAGDREEWVASKVLNFPRGAPLRDAKPGPGQLRDWYEAVSADGRAVDAELLCALVAEGAFDRSGNAKPTHLHFTAGRQLFLEMARDLARGVTTEHLHEALAGPWAYQSPLPSFSWDARGERIYAIRATNPSGEKRLGVPGADWLALRGLVFYPVVLADGSLVTTACDRAWKTSAFRWPLWSVPVTRDVARSLVADRTLVSGIPHDVRRSPRDLYARGLLSVLEAPIRRSDQGGYGSFGGPVTLASASSGGD